MHLTAEGDEPEGEAPLYAKLSSNLVLIVHAGSPTKEDSEAVELVRKEFGDKVAIVKQNEDESEGDVMPRLFASTSIYRGLNNIAAFVRGIEGMKDRERSVPA